VPITQAWYAIDSVDVTTMSGRQKHITADVYSVTKDDLKASIGIPPVAEVPLAQFTLLELERKAIMRPDRP